MSFPLVEKIIFLIGPGRRRVRILAALRQSCRAHPRRQTRSRFLASPARKTHLGFFLGSAVPGQSDPGAASAGPRPRLRLLGILRLRAGHPESFRHRPGIPDSSNNVFGDAYMKFAAAFGVVVADLHHRASSSAASSSARHGSASSRRIRRHRASDLPADGDLYCWSRFRPPNEKPLWWAHTLALLAFLPLIPHTKHLHLVLCPADYLSFARRLQPHPAARRRRGFRARHRQGHHPDRRAAGLFLRRMRPLHRALPGRQHR